MRITKAITFDAAHRVPGHPKCGNLHGHTWRVEATVEGPVPESGMVFDFGLLGDLLKEHVHQRYDHRLILGVGDADMGAAIEKFGQIVVYTEGPPTAERFGLDIAAMLGPTIQQPCRLVGVTVWETANSHIEIRL